MFGILLAKVANIVISIEYLPFSYNEYLYKVKNKTI